MWLEMYNRVIVAEKITKVYPNGVKANADVSLEVCSGETACIMGPNGAGKTTLVRQIMGLLKPTSGRITVLGFNPVERQEAIRRSVAYVPQLPLVFPAHRVIEVVRYVADLAGTPHTRVQEVLELLGLWDFRDRLGYQLSVGQRKLLLLAQALVKDSELMILDEPTSYIDVLKKRAVWDVLAYEKSKGKTLLLVSHDLEEVRRLCDRVYLMLYGRVVDVLSSLDSLHTWAEVKIISRFAGKLAQLFTRGDVNVGENIVVVKYQKLVDALQELEQLVINGEYRDDIRVYLEYPSVETILTKAVTSRG
ncbi:MAG: ABC transporter ATP-binding protein [Desulfurococcaceae archaeon]